MEKVIRKLNEYYVGKGGIYLQNITGLGDWTLRGTLHISEVRLEEKPHLYSNPYAVFYLRGLLVEGVCPGIRGHKYYTQVPLNAKVTAFFISRFMLHIYKYYGVKHTYTSYQSHNWCSNQGKTYLDEIFD